MRQKMIRNLMIIAGVLLGIVLIILGIAIYKNRDKTAESNGEAIVEEYDITTTGSGEIDPENIDSNEVGVYMSAEELEEAGGKSNGIDVSKWQGKIDWKKVKESGIEFAFIRIGYRGEDGKIYKDDNADYNIQQAQKADVLVGVYFFSTAINEAEAKEEANWTKQAIAGYSISYPVVYDCEGFSRDGSRMYGLTAEERTNYAMTFLKIVSDAGYDTMFYSSLSDAENQNVWDISKIEKEHKVWIAEYSDTIYPKQEKPGYGGKCHAWQYTNKGTVNGIDDKVDMVVCYFTKEKEEPKDSSVKIAEAAAPLTAEDKIYTAVEETVTAKDMTNLRKAATTNSDIEIVLMNGMFVKRIGIGTNGWSKLDYNGKIVYAITSYLTTDLSVNESEKVEVDIVDGKRFTPVSDEVTAKEYVNLREFPNKNSDIIATLQSGEFATRTAESDSGWSRLLYNGYTVYAVTSYLSQTVVDPVRVEEVYDSEGYKIVNEQVTAKSETNLRTAPSTDSSDVVYTLKNGEYVKRVGVHGNGWSKLEYNGQTVYAISSYLVQ